MHRIISWWCVEEQDLGWLARPLENGQASREALPRSVPPYGAEYGPAYCVLSSSALPWPPDFVGVLPWKHTFIP